VLSELVLPGCARAKVKFTVTKCDLSVPGRVGLRLAHDSWSTNEILVIKHDSTGYTCVSQGIGEAGKIGLVIPVSAMSTLRLFVASGESFVLAPGEQRRFLRFRRKQDDTDEVVEYIVEVRAGKTGHH
jgi:hypothetical protein